MKIIISGSSGLIGRWLVADLEAAGHEITRLVRPSTAEPPPDSATWNPARGELDPSVIEGADAIINLNGSNIGAKRWNAEVKKELVSSRVDSTRTIVDAIANTAQKPPLLINASAVGLYGDRGDEILDESSPPGEGFLADLAKTWEQTAVAAASDSTRVVLLRLAMVVGKGGAIDRMLLPFNLGMGGPMGSGDQWWPWIAMEDVIGTVRFALENSEVDGPLNLASPQEVTSKGFAKALGSVLNRPSFMPLPAFAAKLAMGEMADALLLASTRAHPTALRNYGYEFRLPDLEAAIRHAID
jgi:uncharacterized protein (TIGR01777 family)